MLCRGHASQYVRESRRLLEEVDGRSAGLARTALAIELTKRERCELHLEHSLTHPAEFRARPLACAQCRIQAYFFTEPDEQPCDLLTGFAFGVAFLCGHVVRA